MPGYARSSSGRRWCRRRCISNRDKPCSRLITRGRTAALPAASAGRTTSRPCREALRRPRWASHWRPERRWSSWTAGESFARERTTTRLRRYQSPWWRSSTWPTHRAGLSSTSPTIHRPTCRCDVTDHVVWRQRRYVTERAQSAEQLATSRCDAMTVRHICTSRHT